MGIGKFLKQTLYICFIGFSLFSFTFIISLLIGTAADHPVLGSVNELVGYAEGIIACSVGMSVANVLSTLSLQRMPKRQTYSARSARTYSIAR